MALGIGWTQKGDGKHIPPGEVVKPDERLSWGRTVGFGLQHVFAMFGATFVFPLIMGLNPQFGIMMSGVATIIFLLVARGRIPSYLGTSASFVAAAAAIAAQTRSSGESYAATLTGAVLIAGVLLAVIGAIVHAVGGAVVSRVLPPAVTGAVVMLIGFNLAPVVAGTYWPQDQWVALATMVFVTVMAIASRGFVSRIAILLGLVFGTALSWLFDVVGLDYGRASATGEALPSGSDRLSLAAVKAADWVGLPQTITKPDGSTLAGPHLPIFSAAAILVVLPGVIALVAENAGHVKAVAEMTGQNLDTSMGAGFIGDGVGTAVSAFAGGPPTTTYAENIGVMAATRVYSTAAYWVAAGFAILLGFSPKFGALIAAIPGGVLGGITVVLYGMIGLLGAKIWVENNVDLGNPINLVPLAAGLIIGIGNVQLRLTESFSITGIALGTIVVIVLYHLARAIAPGELKRDLAAGVDADTVDTTVLALGDVRDPDGLEHSPWESRSQGPRRSAGPRSGGDVER
ncbi:uracil-xanthine permease family protein [Cumulibacter manganitolerans]|uniref:uracil-xanthine permease family protein n=1 Tax=Cumulibacter manganitolerans TaxID=1884992 RepID=UPI00129488DB|nr:solute carrier family 23 protein [Cumulibacter manganitolerans]